MQSRSAFLAAGAAAAGIAAIPRRAAADPVALRIVSFTSPSLLPVYAAIDRGFYARENLAVTITTTPGSVYQFQHFSAGDSEIATTAMDNVIAYDAGQGEAKLASPADFVAIFGGDNGFLRFYARPGIASVADLKGATLAVDALSTGYAFVLRALLAAGGLHDGDYTLLPLGSTPARLAALIDGRSAATMISAPGDFAADAAGMHRLGDVYATIGAYQASVTMVRLRWLLANQPTAEAYVRATRAGLAWVFDPANRDAATALLVARAGLKPADAAVMLRLMLAPGGLSPTGAIDLAGVRNVIALREKYAVPSVPLADPANYFIPIASRADASPNAR